MIDVVLCASGADEVRLVGAMSTDLAQQVRVVRRCVDVPELLGAATSGLGDVVIVDVDLDGLDRSAVHTILTQGTAVIALVNEYSRQVPADVGIVHELSGAADVDQVYAVLIEAVAIAQETPMSAWEEPEAALQQCPLITVWGPTGAPGRTFVATELAYEAAVGGVQTLLVDADTTGPCVSQVLGILDESPGIVAACRASLKGTLTPASLGALTPYVSEKMRVLSGIGVASRWAEVHPSALAQVLQVSRQIADAVIVDVSASLEEDPAAEFTGAGRTSAALTCLENSSQILAVVSADPVSMTRFIREAERLREVSAAPLSVVLNRMDATVSRSRVEASLRSRVQFDDLLSIPLETTTVNRALWDGAMLAEAAAGSEVRRALQRISEGWLGPRLA